MKKYPSIRYPTDDESDGVFASGDVVIQEKMDGGNFRFTLERNLDEQFHTDDRDIVFGSRNVIYKNQKDETKQFAEPMAYIRENADVEAMRELEEEYGAGLTFYGEAMVPHTLTYDWENTPGFLGFDIRKTEDFLDYADMRNAFDKVGLPIAPIIDVVSAEAWDDYSADVDQSAFGDVKAEGLTFKNYDTQTFAKFVREDFKEKNGKTFGKSKKQQASGAEKLSYQYITNARIKKQVHKMIDEGPWDSMQMEMMGPTGDYPGLPELVIRDMAEEEAGNIFMSESWEVDIGDFRSTTSSRCANVLRQMINEREFEELN